MAEKKKTHEPSRAAKKLIGKTITYEITRKGRKTLTCVTIEDVKSTPSYIEHLNTGKRYTGVKFKMRPFSNGKKKKAFWSATHPDKLIKQ